MCSVINVYQNCSWCIFISTIFECLVSFYLFCRQFYNFSEISKEKNKIDFSIEFFFIDFFSSYFIIEWEICFPISFFYGWLLWCWRIVEMNVKSVNSQRVSFDLIYVSVVLYCNFGMKLSTAPNDQGPKVKRWN